MSYHVALTMKSRNAKTGPIPVSTTSEATCPTACPLASGCYAASGPLALFWRKVSEKRAGADWGAFLASVAEIAPGALWRHNQAGDLPGDRETVDGAALDQLVKAQAGRRGFTYTHYDVLANAANRDAVRAANAGGFTVNLSGNNPAHADALADTGAGPVVTILPGDVSGNVKLATPAGRRIVVCPATYRDDVSCAACGLCAVATRQTVVGFPAHGTGKRRASAIAEGAAA